MKDATTALVEWWRSLDMPRDRMGFSIGIWVDAAVEEEHRRPYALNYPVRGDRTRRHFDTGTDGRIALGKKK